MKHIVLAAFALALIALVRPASAIDNEPTGFRGIEWGTPLDVVRGKVGLAFNQQIETDIAEYRSRANLSMNGVPLRYILYRFYRGRFFAGIMFTDFGQRESMIETLTARFGQPADTQGKEITWYGPTTIVILMCAAWEKSCAATFQSTAIVAEQMKDRAASAKSSKDF
jgi:hypothetical protein